MKLGLVQSNILWEDKNANRQKALEWMREAAECGVDLLLFPEMSFTGFSMNIAGIAELPNEDDGTVNFLKETAVKYQLNVGAGWTERLTSAEQSELSEGRENARGKNHYTIVNRKGETVLDYVKMHPFSFSGEDKYYEAGDGYEVAELEGMPLTAFICYDLRFPMNFWKASEQAHLILVPANWPERRIEQWKVLLQARAIENQVYIAAVNCLGMVGDIPYSGASCVINPKGEVLAMIENEEKMLVIDIEDDVELQRKKFPVHQDRRPEER